MPTRRKSRSRPAPRTNDLAARKAALARSLRRRRSAGGISQGCLADLLGSSQSRISKIEAGDTAVSLDLLVRALLAAGGTRGDVARAIGSSGR